MRYLLRSANPSRNKKFQPLVQIVRQGSRGQYVNAPERFNGASTALPRRPSGLLERARDPISFPLRFVEAPLKQGMHGRALPESSAFEQSALIHGVTSAAAKMRCEENLR